MVSKELHVKRDGNLQAKAKIAESLEFTRRNLQAMNL
jgi:hypothetical protein